MNPVYDFSAVDHAVMLGDQVRLELYHRAIVNQVKAGTIVAEIGTGTGILSAYAAAQTKASVYGIEYYDASAKMAEDMMKAAKLDQVKILRGKSFNITLPEAPEVLITETIGALGPEENIVELCHDFKKRHPSLQTIIPSRLKICAEPIRSKKVVDYEQGFYDYFASASFGTFDFQAIHSTLNQIWCGRIRYDSLTGSTPSGKNKVVVDYLLGETLESAFSYDLEIENPNETDAVHLYFEATLDQEVLLTTHFSEPTTHWGNAYVSRPKNSTLLNISYSPKIGYLDVRWKN